MPHMVPKSVKVSEGQVVEVWQHQLLGGAELVTEGGELIRIIYPGRVNDDRGADFRDAVIATGSGLVRGDVEVHVKSSDWRAHRHHRDAAYNQVVLHVVMWHDAGVATSLQSGKSIPVVALHKYTKGPAGQWTDGGGSPASFSMPCREAARRLPGGAMAEFLDSVGEERFSGRVARLQADLGEVGAGQCLYQGIMGALDYARNELPFLELARRLPVQALEAVTGGGVPEEECFARQQALLLGTAGLLPSQREWGRENRPGDAWLERLEGRWALLGGHNVMSAGDWRLFKIRPANSPIRRILAMSYLLLRYREVGMVNGIINMVKEAPLSQGHRGLEEGLLVSGGYGAVQFEPGTSGGVGNQTLLGSQRAADMVVNVLLPFSVAWSRHNSQPEVERKALELYRRYPRLAVNTIERHIRSQLGISGGLVSSAQRQQGLIHIYKTLCAQGVSPLPFGGISPS